MKEFIIKTDDETQRKTMLDILLGMGYKWHGEARLINSKTIIEVWPGYPNIVVRVDDKYIAGNAVKRDYNFNFSTDLYKILDLITNPQKPDIIVNGIGKYEAVISEKEITVGCTKISFYKFDEIAKAVSIMREKK